MRNLLNFILRYSTWFLFVFYVLLSCILLFSDRNGYHRSVYLTSANIVSSGVFGTADAVTGYFNLREINRELQASNANLENDVLNLRMQLDACRSAIADSVVPGEELRYAYTMATVLNNSTRHPRNYFTINRGSNDGIKPGMGVVDHNGIVGIVNVAGPNTARIMSVLNETQHFSVRLGDSPYVGSLAWRGMDPQVAYVEEIPRHAKYSTGDTVVTSGYSTTFPAGIPVGTIQNRVKSSDDNYYCFKVRLLPDFKALSTVRVIKDIYKEQLDSLQNFDIKTDE